MIRRTPRRAGFTVLELMVVLTIILLLGAIVAPSLMGYWSNNRTKAGVDVVTGRLADARGAAISQGRAYRVSASPDGRRVRVAPDESEPAEELATEQPAQPLSQTDTLPAEVQLTPISVGGEPPMAEADGWTTLAVFLPDGTCRDTVSEFQVSETDTSVTPQVVRVRGLTGVWTVNPLNRTAGGTP